MASPIASLSGDNTPASLGISPAQSPVATPTASSEDQPFECVCGYCDYCDEDISYRIRVHRILWPPSSSHEVWAKTTTDTIQAYKHYRNHPDPERLMMPRITKGGKSRCGEKQIRHREMPREDDIQCCQCGWNTTISFQKDAWEEQKKRGFEKCSVQDCRHEFCDKCIIHRRLLCWVRKNLLEQFRIV